MIATVLADAVQRVVGAMPDRLVTTTSGRRSSFAQKPAAIVV